MAAPDSTRWTVIRDAAASDAKARAEFARRYGPVVRAYLEARWRSGRLRQEVDDAAQEVFVECFRAEGPLTRADPEQPGGFRAYLYGLVRNVARGVERRWRTDRGRMAELDLAALEARDAPLAEVFDRAWVASILRQAGERQAKAACEDPRATRRVELLRLRFAEDLPIREVARRWEVEAAFLHEEYRRARREFLAALREVVGENQPGSPAAIGAECARLLDHLP